MRKLLQSIFILILILFLYTGLLMAEDVNQKISDIVIRGNEHVAADEILSAVETKVGDTFDREKIKKELQAIYDLGYFQDIKVALKNYNEGLRVIFEVEENPILTEIKIYGNKIYNRKKIIDWLGIESGKILNMKKLNDGLKDVQHKYQDNGYVLTKFTDVNIDKQGIISLTINPGYLNEVIIKGNEKTEDFVIKRELDFEKGQILNINEVKEAYRDLYKLNYFTEINPELENVSGSENRVNLVIDLKEAKTGSFNFGGGYSSADGWYGFLKLTEENLFGNGQTLGFDWEFGDINNYSLNFYEPWIMGYPTSLGISIYDETSDIENDNQENYTENRRGGSVSLGHALGKGWDGSVKYKIEDYEKIMEESENTDYDVRSLTLKADRDTRNHPFNPTDGVLDIASIEYAGGFLNGDYTFTKYNIDVRRFYPGFKSGQAWALRFKTGIGEGDIPSSEQYSLGGSQTLRGYDTYEFMGDDMLLMNLEYRFPIADKFSGVVFADGGNTWDNIDAMSLDDINYSLGLGVRFNLPIGQIRLDYGWNEQGESKPHFSIGNTF